MHWDVWAVRTDKGAWSNYNGNPQWRAKLCDRGSHFDNLLFTFPTLDGVIGLVKQHDHLYPVYLCCYWSLTVEREARAALQRHELQLTESCIPF